MGKIIALHSYKGGTGKTLLSTNLSAAYVSMGKNVCLLDLDFRAPSLQSILKLKNPEHWLNDYLHETCDIKKVLIDISDRFKGGKFFVGLANPSTEAIREMSAKDRKWEMKALGRLLALKTSLIDELKLDYTIFDTSPGLQYSSINAIVSADVVLVVTSRDRSDVEGTHRMIHELYELFEKKTGLILNKVPLQILSSKSEKKKLFDELLDSYDVRLVETIPCFCDILQAAGSRVFALEAPDHPFTQILQKVAKRIDSF
jgi:MinD-like ATPase involved in chromosome partitioning or flagellar assembly